jgi:hypothetical protein
MPPSRFDILSSLTLLSSIDDIFYHLLLYLRYSLSYKVLNMIAFLKEVLGIIEANLKITIRKLAQLLDLKLENDERHERPQKTYLKPIRYLIALDF